MIRNQNTVLKALIQEYNEENTILLDLDDTLFSERDYLEVAYQKFSQIVYQKFQIPAPHVFRFIMKLYNRGDRSKILQMLKFEIQDYKNDKAYIDFNELKTDLFHFLRDEKYNHKLELYEWAADFFKIVKKYENVGIITNGNVRQQANKISLLGLDHIIDQRRIFYANNYAPKPSTKVMYHVRREMKLQNPVYVGDSTSDHCFAYAAKLRFLKIEHQI